MNVLDIPMSSFAAYTGLVTLLVVTPGADMALITSSTIRGGMRGALSTMIGINAGSIIWTIGAAAGMGTLLALAPMAYPTLLYAGALYMVYIGIKEIRAGLLSGALEGSQAVIEASMRSNHPDLFRRGFFTNILNPKIGLFYTTFIPQFVPVDRPLMRYILLFGIVHNVIGFCWFMTYASILTRLSPILNKPNVKRFMFIGTGVVILAVAAIVIRGHLQQNGDAQ